VTFSLPLEVKAIFDRYLTAELTTLDRRGQPITWPVTPYHHVELGCIDVTTGLGYPKKARDAAANPRVALLFSDPTGSGLERPPMVLVQGTAVVDDRDLEANRMRYERESRAKLPAEASRTPPEAVRRRLLLWHYARIYLHVRPERVYVWPEGDAAAEPGLFDAHMEEVRSGHSEEPEEAPAAPAGGAVTWDARVEELGRRHSTAVLSFPSPDGFPFALRAPVHADAAERRVRIDSEAIGAPLFPGRACLTAHAHDPRLRWRESFQLRGDLVPDEHGWSLVPHRVVGGFERPRSRLAFYGSNLPKFVRFHRTARRELARRRG
jgi:hypothetical protein